MKEIIKKQKYLIIFFICIILVLLYGFWPRKIVIRLGIYAGSRWDVPNLSTENAFDYAIKRFLKKHKNVKIVYESGIRKKEYSEWLSTKILNGQAPDVYIVPDNDFYSLVKKGALLNLNKEINDETRNLFYPVTLETGKIHNQIYALPFEANPVMMCVNTDLLQKENIKVPDSNWTLNDFYQICKQLKENNHGYYGVNGYFWEHALAAYGGDIKGKKGQILIDSPTMHKALSFISELKQIDPNKNILQKDFDEGKVAFFPMTLAQYRTYKPYPYRVMKYSKLSWKCIQLPSSSKKTHATQVKTALIGVSKSSKHKKMATEFIKFLSTDVKVQQEFMNQSQGSSVLKKVVNSNLSKNKFLGNTIGTGILTLKKLDNMLNNSVSDFTFSYDNKRLERIDYLLNLAIEEGNIDLALPSIQEEINRKW